MDEPGIRISIPFIIIMVSLVSICNRLAREKKERLAMYCARVYSVVPVISTGQFEITVFIEDHWRFEPIIGLGLVEPPQSFLDGMTAGFFISDPEAAAKHAQEAPRLPYEQYQGSGMVFGPAATVNFSPDLVMTYCNSGQLRFLLLALGYKEGYMVNSEFYAIGSCTRAAVPPLLTHEASITVPDPGERDRAMTGEDMMILTLPAMAWPVSKGHKRNLFEDLMYGINTLSNWLPYKTSFSPSMQPNFRQPPFYEAYFADWGLDPPVQ